MKEKLVNILHYIVSPPRPYKIGFGLLFLAAAGITLLTPWRNTIVAYLIYMLSALGLYYLILAFFVPLIRRIRRLLHKIPFMHRYYTNQLFRSRVILYRGVLINTAYALFKFVTGIWYKSTWLIAIAVFFMILTAIKATLVYQDTLIRKNKRAVETLMEWNDYRRTGWLMLLLNIGLTAINIHVIMQGQKYSYPGVLIYAMAFYAFYRLTVAIVRVVKGRGGSPLFKAARAIDFSFAVTAMFTLQTAMYNAFSPERDVTFQNAIGGAVTALIVNAIAIYMIIQGSRQLKAGVPAPSSDA